MYELLILGALMIHPRTGYKLRKILGGSLDPRREISNGVMYPLLHKLATAGFITLRDVEDDTARGSKLAEITEKGEARFNELMHEPIAVDAKRESMFRFKFRGLGRESTAYQRDVLTAYQTVVQEDLTVYRNVRMHLESIGDRPERKLDLGWTLRTIDLQIRVAETKLAWAAEQLAQIEDK